MAFGYGDRDLRSLRHAGFAALAAILSLVSLCAHAQITPEASPPATAPAAAPPAAPPIVTPQPTNSAPAAAVLPAPAAIPVTPKVPAAAAGSSTLVRPLWHELTPAQKLALAPMAGDWDALDSFRKKKWLEIGAKFATMKPDEQQRVQERMREWTKLTPEQRRIARDSFARTKKLDAEQKSAQWQQYQQLPDDQKKKLAADASTKTPVARLPSPNNNKSKTLAPIKATPKPVLEKSVTPQATTQSDIGPSPLPENK